MDLSKYASQLKKEIFQTMKNWKPTGTKIVTGKTFRSIVVEGSENTLQVSGDISAKVMETGSKRNGRRIRRAEKIMSEAACNFLDAASDEILEDYADKVFEEL